jgi:hypothetical protein
MLAGYKHSSLFDPFISYTKNEVLWIHTQSPYSQHFSFFVTYELAQYAGMLHYIRLEMFVRDIHYSLLDPFVGYTKMMCFEYTPRAHIHNTLISS